MIRASVFDTAPSGAGPSGDTFRLRNGMVRRGKPVALAVWRVTTDSSDVAETIESLFGGSTSENDSDKEPLQVMTEAEQVDIVIAPGGIDTGFALWHDGKLVRKCNGETQTQGDEEGLPCPCAGMSWDERKAAGAGTCKADVLVRFTLADAPDLGEGVFRSGNLTLMRDIQRAEARVQDAEGDTNATLTLTEVKMSNGKAFHKVGLRLK